MTADTSNTSAPTKLPPGTILGSDGKPCKICTAFRQWKPQTITVAKNRRESNTAAVTGALASSSFQLVQDSKRRVECPPDKEELGRSAWTFLHTVAAYYPERPTPAQRAHMLMLIQSLPVLYPCKPCAVDFGEDLEAHPPDIRSGERLSKWLCDRHNEVNEKLGKEKFDCARVFDRWKNGPSSGSCD